MILATDVHYGANGATAAGVAFSNWEAERPERLYVSRSNEVKAYRPGHFYERELPCLLRAGDVAIGDTAFDSPSDAERARRERMKREG